MASGDETVTLSSLKIIAAFFRERKAIFSAKQYIFTEAATFRPLLFSTSVTENIQRGSLFLMVIAPHEADLVSKLWMTLWKPR